MKAQREPAARAALRRPAAARRARPRACPAAARAAARRAALGARSEAQEGDADRAQAAAARDRDHLRLRHPRSGGGADDVGPDRGDERGPDPADRLAARDLRPARRALRRELHRREQFPDGRNPGARGRAGPPAPCRRHRGHRRPSPGAGPDGEVTIAVRPEHVHLATAGEAGTMAGTLGEVVYFGTDTHYHVRLDAGECWWRGSRTCATARRRPTPAPGSASGCNRARSRS